MEEQLIVLLANTLATDDVRKQAEVGLKQAEANPAFPLSLANIAAHTSVDGGVRIGALLTLRRFIARNWTEDADDEEDDSPRVPVPDHVKDQLRPKLLELAISDEDDTKIKSSVSYAVSKIANVDFPERWPQLVPTLLSVMPNGTDNQLHGALKVLSEFVEENLSEDQFFSMARDIVSAVYQVALSEERKGLLRAFAVSVFRSCFDLLDMVKDDHPKEVKGFAEEALSGWLPFFQQVLKSPLPESAPTPAGAQPDAWNGPVALKLQVVKTLLKIKGVFPSLLLPHSITFFQLVWEELSRLEAPYAIQYLESDTQGRLQNADNIPYTLDWLVLEELDFLNHSLRAAPVQKELEAHNTPWVLDMIKLIVSFSRITREEEELWDIDVSLYLAEEGSITANYTARTACGDFLIKLGEWLVLRSVEALFTYTKTLFASEGSDWRTQEASLYLFTMLATDLHECEKEIPAEVAQGYLELVKFAIGRTEQPLLQARGYLVAGTIAKGFAPALVLLDQTVAAITSDPSDLVNVACIKAVENFVKSESVPADRQVHILKAVETFLNGKDLQELEDADDLLVTLTESLRAAIGINRRVVLAPDVKSLDLLFLLAQHGAQNYQVTMLVNEVFEEIVQYLATDSATYATLCTRVLPTLTGAFNYADVTQNEPLITLAAELVAVLLQSGVEPLPAGIVAQLLPKLSRVLMESTEGEILRPGAEAVKYMVMHDHHQVFGWHDEQGKSGLEVCLYIIDRLLGPSIEDNAASEVGGLAAELVEKAGQERLGPYLLKLLQAVATRLASATAASFIQSLILVFARLSLSGAADVVQFLSGIEIDGQNGLQVVMSKWLENSTFFAGFDEIRQNVIALSKLYSLNDARLAQCTVKGDLIVDQTSDKILTRSRARQLPDKYTFIPAPLKILKVLIDELLFASGKQAAAMAAADAAKMAELDEDEGDDGWEDEPGVLDLSLGTTKNDLMSYFEGGGNRVRDDETQQYLTEFFLQAARENTAGFTEWYAQLTEEEKGKLNEIAAQ
ncbi:hypothetical protein RB601_002649 [Gaeumannomyces tritici]